VASERFLKGTAVSSGWHRQDPACSGAPWRERPALVCRDKEQGRSLPRRRQRIASPLQGLCPQNPPETCLISFEKLHRSMPLAEWRWNYDHP